MGRTTFRIGNGSVITHVWTSPVVSSVIQNECLGYFAPGEYLCELSQWLSLCLLSNHTDSLNNAKEKFETASENHA